MKIYLTVTLRCSEKRLAYVRVTLPQRQATKHLDTADFHNVTFFEKQKTDITFLQETYSTPEIISDWKFQWHGEMIFSHGSNHCERVLVLINNRLQYE